MSVPWSIFEVEDESCGDCVVGPYVLDLWEHEHAGRRWVGSRHLFLRLGLMRGAKPHHSLILKPTAETLERLIDQATSAPHQAPTPTENTPFQAAYLGPLTRAGLTVSGDGSPLEGRVVYQGDEPVGFVMPVRGDGLTTVRTVSPALIAAYERVSALGLPDALAWATAALALGGDA